MKLDELDRKRGKGFGHGPNGGGSPGLKAVVRLRKFTECQGLLEFLYRD